MEFPSAQRLKSGNSRSLIFGVLMFWPTLRAVVSPGRDTSYRSVRPRETTARRVFWARFEVENQS